MQISSLSILAVAISLELILQLLFFHIRVAEARAMQRRALPPLRHGLSTSVGTIPIHSIRARHKPADGSISKECIMLETRKFLRLPAVIEATGWSRATIWRKVKLGVLPAPISIGPKTVAWDSAEIAQWQQRCIDASRRAG